ncbi:basal body-orientation factor 1-like [Rhopilema esculentum]|uniref:basal body-orientation factor 1-like n=1 Tax=Rhopilema esculentum TaxID=499914 RepID=UPI0031D1BD45|eukprot:gene13622-4519_t
MPKKIKKQKSKSKGKTKGKKGSKASSKDDKESVLKNAVANARLWEGKLYSTERAKQEYRENAKKLLYENEGLQNQMAQIERDTVDVISFLKKEDMKKDDQVDKLQQIIKDLKRDFRKEKQTLIDQYTQKIHTLQEQLAEKTNEVKLMQSELKMVKEFRRKRAQMQKELDEIKDSLFHSEKQHKETLSLMEHKFFEEKMRLQQEAGKKISELAEQAHAEAVSNLDETTRAVYKENIRLNEALAYHLKETENLEKTKDMLEKKNKTLMGEEELNSLVVQEKVVQTKQLQKRNKELTEKVAGLEKALSHMVREFEEERGIIVQDSSKNLEQSKMEVARLQRTVELKTKEMNRVKKLAKNILDQRCEIEQFFLDSLEHVKNEIVKNRNQYKKEAQIMYRSKMLAAHAGEADYPKVRTFLPLGASTNSVFDDMKEAEKWIGIEGKVDIKELTWEQRERVLRMLFAKINGLQNERRKQQVSERFAIEGPTKPDVLKLDSKGNTVTDGFSSTFITQNKVDEPGSSEKKHSEPIELPALS